LPGICRRLRTYSLDVSFLHSPHESPNEPYLRLVVSNYPPIVPPFGSIIMPKTNGTYGTSWLWIKTCPRFHITRAKAGCSSPQTEKSPTPGNLKSFISIPFAAALPVSSSNFSVITVAIAPSIVRSWGDLSWRKPAMGAVPLLEQLPWLLKASKPSPGVSNLGDASHLAGGT